MNDPIADLLTRVRNAQQVGLTVVSLPHSKIKEQIVRVLQEEGYITSYEIDGEHAKKTMKLQLKYIDGEKVIKHISRVSKSSARRYSSARKMPKVCGALGTMIVTTSLGVMTGRQAEQKKVGGELLCEVY
jgi:small subunit ribosomal protein S8